jgi:mannose-1-phosphate guanylyltransferase
VILAVNYMYEQVKNYFEARELEPEVVVVNEPEPLGTGGAIKNVEGHVSGTFAVCNGDVVDSLDLESFSAFHHRAGGIGSVAVWPVDDPTAFGVVALDGDRITRFLEKPSEGEAPSNLINAGHYVFEPEVFDVIDANRAVSLEREVFPKLIPRGLHAYRWTGYWSDAGTLPAYLRAQRILLGSGRAGLSEEADTSRGEIRPPVLVAAGCFLEGRVGPFVVLGRGCRIGRATVRNATLFDGVSVDDKAEVDSSIVGESAAIGEGAIVRDSIVGDGVQVPPHSEVISARVAA